MTARPSAARRQQMVDLLRNIAQEYTENSAEGFYCFCGAMNGKRAGHDKHCVYAVLNEAAELLASPAQDETPAAPNRWVGGIDWSSEAIAEAEARGREDVYADLAVRLRQIANECDFCSGYGHNGADCRDIRCVALLALLEEIEPRKAHARPERESPQEQE